MGRPRKEPRRILTFNLPLSLAEEIDRLNLSNRSEWLGLILRESMDGRKEQRDLFNADARLDIVEEARDELLRELQNEPRRLAIMLYSSLQRKELMNYKPKGRYTLADLLLTAINDQSGGGLLGNWPDTRGDE